MDIEVVELLTGIAEIATAVAGFTGVVVAFGSRGQGAWHPGDRLRLGFLLQASFTAAGFSLLALVSLAAVPQTTPLWQALSAGWAVFMSGSLRMAHCRLQRERQSHGDFDDTANNLMTLAFLVMMTLQLANCMILREVWPFLAALALNLAGAAMQFMRLIRSAFREPASADQSVKPARLNPSW